MTAAIPGVTIIRETDDYVLSQYNGSGRPSKDRKFLCIGGAFNGQRKAGLQLPIDTYTRFNRADSHNSHNRWLRRSKRDKNTQVFVHMTLLK